MRPACERTTIIYGTTDFQPFAFKGGSSLVWFTRLGRVLDSFPRVILRIRTYLTGQLATLGKREERPNHESMLSLLLVVVVFVFRWEHGAQAETAPLYIFETETDLLETYGNASGSSTIANHMSDRNIPLQKELITLKTVWLRTSFIPAQRMQKYFLSAAESTSHHFLF